MLANTKSASATATAPGAVSSDSCVERTPKTRSDAGPVAGSSSTRGNAAGHQVPASRRVHVDGEAAALRRHRGRGVA